MRLEDAAYTALCVKIVTNIAVKYPYIFASVWNDLIKEDIIVDKITAKEIIDMSQDLKED